MSIGGSLGYLAKNEIPSQRLFSGGTAEWLALALALALWLGLPAIFHCISSMWVIGYLGVSLILCWTGYKFTHGRAGLQGVDMHFAVAKRLVAVVVSGGFLVLAGYLVRLWIVRREYEEWKTWTGTAYPALGLSVIFASFALISFIWIGLLGGTMPDAKREWLGRLAGYRLYFAIVFGALLSIALWGTQIVDWVFITQHQRVNALLLRLILPGGWIFTTLAGLLAARSPATGNNTKHRGLELLAGIAPPLFLLGAMIVASWGTHWMTQAWLRPKCGTGKMSQCWWQANEFAVLFSVCVVGAISTSWLSRRVNVNEFSLHLFYRNRLVRTFLGASNANEHGVPQRKANPFTGFAMDDDHFLGSLQNGKFDGPYPIWGTALNMTSGEDLAWQQRKAASFIFSPLFCGWDYYGPRRLQKKNLSPYGYRAVAPCDTTGKSEMIGYGGEKGAPLIGTAMAASGAAISPNWGYHTKPAIAALLAIFNIRIGWWTGNPRHKEGWKKYSPKAGCYLSELFGATGADGEFVYLSDGGHFENLGIYELIRRRVRYIVACDADADPAYSFGDLANAVEKCRVDFGVQIRMAKYTSIAPENASGLSSIHYAIGLIDYLPVDPDDEKAPGVLLYIKSSLTGDEAAQVLGQRADDSVFPHDTTLNQFFNETKFEAYRALGEHLASYIWDNEFLPSRKDTQAPSTPKEHCDLIREFFNEFLRGQWKKAVEGK